MVRIILGEFKNYKVKKEIQNIIDSKTILDLSKLDKINKLVKDITKDFITFAEYDSNILNKLTKIENCYNKNDEDCKTKSNYCFVNNEKCGLLIPQNNLINMKDNNKIYYSRISDELLRYDRMRTFILNSNNFMSLSDLRLKVKDDEIISLESSL